jgi:hypothetical protein
MSLTAAAVPSSDDRYNEPDDARNNQQGNKMPPVVQTETSENAIWSRVLEAGSKSLSPALARTIIGLDFDPEDKRRLRRLAAKAREGALTPAEQEQVDNYGRVGSVLSILKSKARVSLRKRATSNGSRR